MAQILVTGANGFIGSHLVRALLLRGHRVRGLVRATSDLTSLQGLDIELYLGDLREPDSLVAPLRGVDYVYHLGALLLGYSQADFEATNAVGTRNLLEAIRAQHGPELKRVLVTSSHAAPGPSPTPTPIDEASPMQPVSYYGESKRRVEQLAAEYGASLPITVVRPSSVYGDRERDVSQTFPTIAAGLHPRLGLRTRYAVMTHVDDIVSGMIGAAESDATVGQVYFLTHPKVMDAAQVVQTIAQAMDKPNGVPVPVPSILIRVFAPVAEWMGQLSRERPNTTRDKAKELSNLYWTADPAKALRDFGWSAKYDLLNGMKQTTAAYFAEQQSLREMPAEPQLTRWLKFITIAVVLGALIEISSATGKFYSFTPEWIVFIVVFGGFGLGLGTVAYLLRRTGDLPQFFLGSVGTAIAEMGNVLGLTRNLFRWDFSPGWPFGITNDLFRAFVLAFAGGFFVLLCNAIARALYTLRLKKG